MAYDLRRRLPSIVQGDLYFIGIIDNVGIGKQITLLIHNYPGAEIVVTPFTRNPGAEETAEQRVMKQGMNCPPLDVCSIDVDHCGRDCGHRFAIGDDAFLVARFAISILG